MKYLTLGMIKKQCNIDEWFKDDDNYLIGLATTAEQILSKNLDDKLENIMNDNDGVLPSPLIQAMLLFIGHMYRNREAVVFGNAVQLPFGYDFLIGQYKNYTQSKL